MSYGGFTIWIVAHVSDKSTIGFEGSFLNAHHDPWKEWGGAATILQRLVVPWP